MRIIDSDALVKAGQIIMIVGFFGSMLGFLIMVCGYMLEDIL